MPVQKVSQATVTVYSSGLVFSLIASHRLSKSSRQRF